MIQIEECRDADAIAATWPVMAQLRPHIAEAEYPAAVATLRREGARLVAARSAGRVVGAAVFRLQTRLSSGRIVYVDDLVTDGAARSGGVGAALLAWIAGTGRAAGAGQLVLDSAVTRSRAHRFYFREGLAVTAFNFRMPIGGD